MTTGEPPTILIVDDEPLFAKAHARMLGGTYDVESATTGAEALATVDEHVDALILDRYMPDRSGDEIATAIRERGLECSILMLTAVEADPPIIDMGIDDYLKKPVSEATLKTRIQHALEWTAHNEVFRECVALSNKRTVLLEDQLGFERTEPFFQIERQFLDTLERTFQQSTQSVDALLQSSPVPLVRFKTDRDRPLWNASARALFEWNGGADKNGDAGERPHCITEAERQLTKATATLDPTETVTDTVLECHTTSESSLELMISALRVNPSVGLQDAEEILVVLTPITGYSSVRV